MSLAGELKVLAFDLAANLGKIGYPTREKDVLAHIEKEHWLIVDALIKARALKEDESLPQPGQE